MTTERHGTGRLENCAGFFGKSLQNEAQQTLFRLLGNDSPAEKLAAAIGAVIEANQCLDSALISPSGSPSLSATLQQFQLFLATAIHSAEPPFGMTPVFFSDSEPFSPAPLEWLALARISATVSGTKLPLNITETLDQIFATVYPLLVSPPTFLFPADSPLLSYAMGLWFPPHGGMNEAAVALGSLVRLTQEALTLFCSPDVGGSRATPHLLSHIALESGCDEGRLRTAWACASHPLYGLSRLQHLLGQRTILAHIRTRIADYLAACATLPEPARLHVQQLESDCSKALDRALAAAHFSGLFPLPALSRQKTTAQFSQLVPIADLNEAIRRERDRTIRLARDALLEDLTFHEGLDIQRWGAWCEAPRYGRIFPVGYGLLALAAEETDNPAVSAAIEALLDARRVDGYRYFEDWTGIPPGPDDLGIVLQLLPYSERRDALHEALRLPMQQFFYHTAEDGCIPTWMTQNLHEPPGEGSVTWDPRACLGTMLGAILGLVRSSWPLPEGYLERAITYITATYENAADHGAPYYPASYLHLLLGELRMHLDDSRCTPAVMTGFDQLLTSIKKDVLSTWRADGSWGSPLTTAFHLGMLAALKTQNIDAGPAYLYLSAQQEPDGLWPREPIYVATGKDGAPFNYGSRSVTTAFCLRALTLAKTVWP